MTTRRETWMALLTGAVFVLLLGNTGHAQLGAKRTGDPRVQQTLDSIGWIYEVDADGDFKLIFEFEDSGRSQVVYVNSGTCMLGALEIRDVWAPAIISETPFDSELLTELLRESGCTKVGAWCVTEVQQGYLAVFIAQIAADADRQALMTIVQAVCGTADEKEKAVTNGDAM